MCTPGLMLKEQKIVTFEELHIQKACAAISKNMHQWLRLTSTNPSSTNWNPFMPMLSDPHICKETVTLKSFNNGIHFIFISKLAPRMPHNIDLLHVNIPYGMPQLQHYCSGWQTSNHTYLATS